jgi:MFS family permease
MAGLASSGRWIKGGASQRWENIQATNMTQHPLPPHFRRNFWAFLVDYTSFTIGITFISFSSVLPAFVRELTDSAPLIGLVTTTFSFGWLAPQLLMGHFVGDKPRKRPYMLLGATGRIAMPVVAIALWAGLHRHPSTMLTLFFVCLLLLGLSDGVSSIPWFDILARAIPVSRRGRLFGIGQSVTGLAGIGIGAFVAILLERLAFPQNYALLFTLASVGLGLSAIALAVIVELPPQMTEVQEQKSGKAEWLRPLMADRTFRRLLLCRILINMINLAAPFYVGHASDVLLLPKSVIGIFVTAQALASVVASPLLGYVSERWGPQLAIRIGSGSAAIGPAFALVAHLSGARWLAQAYPIVYVALGAMNSSSMLGFTNYMMELAPDGLRPVYIGLANTIMSVLTLVPILGGWLLESTSYSELFGLSAVLAGLGFFVSLAFRPVEEARQKVPVRGRDPDLQAGRLDL